MAWAYFTWYHIPDTPQGYVIYGEFDSEKNFKKYLNSAVVKSIGDELIPLLDAPPKFKHYSVYPGHYLRPWLLGASYPSRRVAGYLLGLSRVL